MYLTNYNRSTLLDQSAITIFNLTDPSKVSIEVWGTALSGRLMVASSMLDVITLVTEVTGRQAGRLPEWSQRGAVVGLEGGTDEVTAIVDTMRQAGVPLAGE